MRPAGEKVMTGLVLAIGKAFKGSMWPSKSVELTSLEFEFLAAEASGPPPGPGGEAVISIYTAGGELRFVKKRNCCEHCKQVMP